MRYIFSLLLLICCFGVDAEAKPKKQFLDIVFIDGYGAYPGIERMRDVKKYLRRYVRVTRLPFKYRIRPFNGDPSKCFEYLSLEKRKELIYCAMQLTIDDISFTGVKRIYIFPPVIKKDSAGREYQFIFGSAFLNGKLGYVSIGDSADADNLCLLAAAVTHEVIHLIGGVHYDVDWTLMHSNAARFVNTYQCNILKIVKETKLEIRRWKDETYSKLS